MMLTDRVFLLRFGMQVAINKKNCPLCGNPETPEDRFTYDHIIPKAHGGPNAIWNLRQVHGSENSKRHHDFTGADLKIAMKRKREFEAGKKMSNG